MVEEEKGGDGWRWGRQAEMEETGRDGGRRVDMGGDGWRQVETDGEGWSRDKCV